MRKRLLAGGAIVTALVVVAAALVGLHLWRQRHQTALEKAVALAPKDGQRYAWTDWDAVRRQRDAVKAAASSTASSAAGSGQDSGQGGSQEGDAPGGASDVLADADESSALAGVAGAFTKASGVRLDDVDWELLVGRPLATGSGQVDLVHLPRSVSADSVRDALSRAGYTVPRRSGGVWDGSTTSPGVASPLLQYAAIDAADQVLLLSDNSGYLASVVAGLHSSSDLPDGIAQAVTAVGSPVAAEIYSGAYLCNALALSNSDPETEAQGNSLVAAAGEIDPVQGFALGLGSDGVVQVAMTFADHDQAKANADSRSRLAVGPAAGQSEGDFTQMFRLGTVEAQDEVVTMALHPTEQGLYSDLLSGGPILFATC